MVFSPNASPLAGREGSQLTSSKIGERLAAEAETSVSLSVGPASASGEAFEVHARGELQLGLLIGDSPLPSLSCPSLGDQVCAQDSTTCGTSEPPTLSTTMAAEAEALHSTEHALLSSLRVM